MFNKEEKSTFNKDWGLDNKKILEESREVFIETPKPDKLNDAGSIIDTINENPGKPAIFENCTGSTFNQVYNAVGRVKPTWDAAKGIIKYKQ